MRCNSGFITTIILTFFCVSTLIAQEEKDNCDLKIIEKVASLGQSKVAAGSDVRCHIQLQNKSQIDVDGIQVQYSLLMGNGESLELKTFDHPTLISKMVIPVKQLIEIPEAVEPGNYMISIVALAPCETDETNNSVELPITVNAPKVKKHLSDLTLLGGNIILDKEKAKRGADFGFTIKHQNTGYGKAKAVTLVIRLISDRDKKNGISELKSVILPEIDGYTTLEIEESVYIPWDIRKGEYILEFEIDSPHNETNVTNNKTEKLILIK
jgi:hypothetical protein